MGLPSLASILRRSRQWSKIIRHLDGQSATADSAVAAMVERVRGIMATTAAALLDARIVLRELHSLLDASSQYLTLAQQLSLAGKRRR